jgi:polysaccharide chain length determinant protein (PEP-CTERM system associated)
MHEVKYAFAIFLRRLPWFLVVAGGISTLAILTAISLPPAYVSQVRLLVESSQIPGDLAESTVQTSAQEQLQIFETRLLTRANLLEISRRIQVPENVGEMSPDQIVDAMRARTSIRISGGRQEATLMLISFEATDAQKAAGVLNEYLTLILREEAQYRTTRAGQTQEFFDQEVNRLGSELSAQSAKILSFKNEHADALPESLEYRRTVLLNQQERLLQIQHEITSLSEQKERLVHVFNSTGRVETGAAQTPEEMRLRTLEAELSGLSSIYSDNHPRVLALKAQVAQAQKLVSAGIDQDDAADQDPARAMFSLQMEEADTRLAFLEEQKAQLEAQMQTLTESIAVTPANAIALDALERDHRNIQEQYNQAVDRLARASTGERIEALSRGRRITVVEQPTAPSAPTKPNRPLIAGGGTFLGIAVGLGLIFALEMLNRTVRRPAALVRRLGVTPIATIPYLRTRRQRMIRRLSFGAAVLVGVTVIPAMIYLLHVHYLPLDLIAARVMDKLHLRG